MRTKGLKCATFNAHQQDFQPFGKHKYTNTSKHSITSYAV